MPDERYDKPGASFAQTRRSPPEAGGQAPSRRFEAPGHKRVRSARTFARKHSACHASAPGEPRNAGDEASASEASGDVFTRGGSGTVEEGLSRMPRLSGAKRL